jgi:hypothetical protein
MPCSAARESPRVRDRADELLTQRMLEDRPIAAAEASFYLRTVEGRWQTDAGRKAVTVLEEAIRAALARVRAGITRS